jgi:hypothetical protein
MSIISLMFEELDKYSYEEYLEAHPFHLNPGVDLVSYRKFRSTGGA